MDVDSEVLGDGHFPSNEIQNFFFETKLERICKFCLKECKYDRCFSSGVVSFPGAVSSSGVVFSSGAVISQEHLRVLQEVYQFGRKHFTRRNYFFKSNCFTEKFSLRGIDSCLSGLTLGVLWREVVSASDTGEVTSSLVTSTRPANGVVIFDVVLACRPLLLYVCPWRSNLK